MATPDMRFVYDPAQYASGWYDGASGLTPPSWIDRDLASTRDDGSHTGGGGVILLAILEPEFWDDPDVIFLLDGSPGTPIPQLPPGVPPTSGVWVELVAEFFSDEDLIFSPVAVRALFPGDLFLKNEVIRIR